MLSCGTARSTIRASAVLVLLLLVSCDGGNGADGARPTISPTRTPTATLPSLSLPSPTRSPDLPDRTESPEPPTPTPSPSPDRNETPGESAALPGSDAPPREPPSQTPTPAEPATEDSSDESVVGSADDEGAPTWVWWLLAALVGGSVVAIPLVIRARRHNAWRQELVEAETDLGWLARELLPGLRQTGSREKVSGGWAVGQARVVAAEDRLTVLESRAPDEAGRQRARSLRDAVRQARLHMAEVTGPEPQNTWAMDLDAIIADLELVLRAPQVSSSA